MAKQDKAQNVSATLPSGTKVTASQEVVDKLKGSTPKSATTSSSK